MFKPPHCPNHFCASESPEVDFRFCRRGSFYRKCDGRRIPRFRCLSCNQGFSSQTFRGNYRWRKPILHHSLMHLLCSKVSRRQAARILGVNRKTVERRFTLLSRVAHDFHFAQLNRCRERGGIHGIFQLDELETFEHNRRIKPVTLAVTIERHSYFVLGAFAGKMGSRGQLNSHYLRRKRLIELEEGPRRSESRRVVRKSLDLLDYCLSPKASVHLQSDKKKSYPIDLKKSCWGRYIQHEVTSSKDVRDYHNSLFPINHTLAMMRDGLSCLVRRSWAASKKKSGLQRHCWIWIAWRNYVRGVTNRTKTTPAQELGVSFSSFQMKEIYHWRWPLRLLTMHTQGGQILL